MSTKILVKIFMVDSLYFVMNKVKWRNTLLDQRTSPLCVKEKANSKPDIKIGPSYKIRFNLQLRGHRSIL